MTDPVIIDAVDSNLLKIDKTEKTYDLFLNNFYSETWKGELVPLFEVKDGKIIYGAGHHEFLLKQLIINDIDFEDNTNESPKKDNIVISDKWKNILDTDFKIIDGLNQYQYLQKLLNYNRACGQFFTGYGKTELILAIVESFLDTCEGNAIILVPDNTIKNEILDRMKKWDFGYDVEYHKFNSRIQIINPIGLSRGKNKSDPKIVEYFKSTKLVMVDEGHHVTASSYIDLIFEKTTYYKYIYAVSGSLDASDGSIPTIKDNIFDSNQYINKLVSIFSYPRVVVKNPVPVKIGYLRCNTTKIPDKIKSVYTLALKMFFNSPDVSKKLVEFAKKYPDRRIFIPIHDTEVGKKLVDRLNSMIPDSALISWSGGKHPIHLMENHNSLKDYLSNSESFRFLVGTSALFEGFDSDRLNTVFLAIGDSFKMAVQPSGRSVRSDDLPVFLLGWSNYDNIKLINNQTRSKYSKLKKEYLNHQFFTPLD